MKEDRVGIGKERIDNEGDGHQWLIPYLCQNHPNFLKRRNACT